MPGAARHDSDVGSLSAIAIKLCVIVARFEITGRLFRALCQRMVFLARQMIFDVIGDLVAD